MKWNRSGLLPVAIALTLLLSVGCASRPSQEEIAAARGAVESARAALAEDFAATELRAAEEALRGAEAEIASQEGKWFKNYGRARELLGQAREGGANAARMAKVAREKVIRDAEAAIAAAETALRVVEYKLGAATVTRSSRADLKIFEADLAALVPNLAEARQSFEGGDFGKALELSTSVQERAAAVAHQVEEALSRQPRPEK